MRVDGPDPLAAGHVCTAAPHKLRETPLKELPGGQIAKGMCTTVMTFAPAAPAFSLVMPVRDSAGTVTLLSVRNWLPTPGTLSVAEAGALLPAGSVIRLLEPYLMRSMGGGAMLRLDNPVNMQLVSRPGLNFDAGGSPEKAEALAGAAEARGNMHLHAHRPAAALDFFSAALSLGDLLSPARRAELLAVRAAAALSLDRYAAALLDCDKAIALDPGDGTAALLRCEALLGTNRSAGAAAFAQALREQVGRPATVPPADPTAGDAAAAVGDNRAVLHTYSRGGVVANADVLLRKARKAEAMRQGQLDIMTVPFTQAGQRMQGVATYVGPIAVRDTGTAKGWGVYLTREVKDQELLLIERPLYARFAAMGDPIRGHVEGEDEADDGVTAGLTYLVQTPGADADGQIAAKLATLHSATGPRCALEPPSEAALRGEGFLPVPPPGILTAKHIRGIVAANGFGASAELQEPTAAQRQPFAWAFDAGAQSQAQRAIEFVASQQKQRMLLPNTPLQGAAIHAVGELLQLNAAKPAQAASHAIAAANGPPGAGDRQVPSLTADPSRADALDTPSTGPTPLQELLASLPPEEVRAMLDVQDANGMTALHFAVEYGRLEDVQALLAAGANPSLVDKRSITPVHAAAALRCNEAMLAALLDAGADVNAVAPGCDTPLQLAMASSEAGSTATVRLLLARGADPLILSSSGASLLSKLHGAGPSNKSARAAQAAHAYNWAGKVALMEAAGFDRDRYDASTHEGTALYWIASYFNHDSDHSAVNTWRVSIGGLMVVMARGDLPAGTELTTVYSESEANLRHRGLK